MSSMDAMPPREPIQLAAPPAVPATNGNGAALPDRRIGFGGLRQFGGLVAEEYLAVLSGVHKIDVFTKMRADGQIEGMLNACKAPIIDGTWSVVASGKQARALRAKELVENQLGIGSHPDGVGDTWQDTVEKMLSYLDYGFQVMVENWHDDGKEFVLDELLDIHPRTILEGSKRWDFDERGCVRGFWQTGYTGNLRRAEGYVPIDRCLHLVNGQRHNNPEGWSILRSSYKHWLLKDASYRADGIAQSRASSGVPFGQYPEGVDPGERQQFEEAVKQIQVCEAGYITAPIGYLLTNFKLEMDTLEMLRSVEHHDGKMVMSILAAFLTLGQGSSRGSAPPQTSSDQIDFFTRMLSAKATKLAQAITRGPAAKIVRYNMPTLATDLYPQVMVNVTRLSVFGFCDAVRKVVGDQLGLWWQPEDQDNLRQRMGLGPLPEGATEPPPRAKAAAPGENNQGDQPNNPESGTDATIPS